MPDTKFAHPREKLTYHRAIRYVEDWLLANTPGLAAGSECSVYDYHNGKAKNLKRRPWAGVRVAEVSFLVCSEHGMAGASYMQTDMPWGLAICAQVEHCILALVEGWNDGEYDETDYEFERLEFLLTHGAEEE